MEGNNFERVAILNTVRHEMERLLDEVKAMDAHFNELLEKKKEVNANRASELSKHQQILLSLKSELSDARGVHKKDQESLDLLFEPIHSTFYKLGCDKIVLNQARELEYLTGATTNRASISDPTTEVGQTTSCSTRAS